MKAFVRNRLLAGVTVIILALSIFVAPAYAGNVGRTNWSFSLSPYSNIGRTGQRQKQNDTPSYVELSKKSDGGTIWAWIERTYQNPDVHSNVRVIGVGKSATIPNEAFDMYGKVQVSACVQNSVLHTGYISVSGLWSPDSN